MVALPSVLTATRQLQMAGRKYFPDAWVVGNARGQLQVEWIGR